MIIKRRTSVVKRQRQNCLVIGDAMVGKTTLIKMILGLPISERYETTVFLDYYTGRVFVPESSESLMLTFTDFSVEADIKRLPTENHSQIIVVCFSITDRESFNNVRSFWLPLIRRHHSRNPVIIVATNVDARDETNNEHVTIQEGRRLAAHFSAHSVLEVSKYHSEGIQNIVDNISSLILQNQNGSKKVNRWKRMSIG